MRFRLRADARDFLAASRPERPIRAQDCNRSDSFRFRQMYYTQLRIDSSRFRFCSFPKYSANLVHAQHLVGADVGIGPYKDLQ